VPVDAGEWLASLPDLITPREYTHYPSNWWQAEPEDVSRYSGEEDMSYPRGDLYPEPLVITHIV